MKPLGVRIAELEEDVDRLLRRTYRDQLIIRGLMSMFFVKSRPSKTHLEGEELLNAFSEQMTAYLKQAVEIKWIEDSDAEEFQQFVEECRQSMVHSKNTESGLPDLFLKNNLIH